MQREPNMKTERSNDRLRILRPHREPSKYSGDDGWRVNQLLALAEVFKESLTPAVIAIYVESLADLPDDQVRLGIGRAIRELRWFPKPAELRDLAGAKQTQQQRQELEANEAFNLVVRHLERDGVMAGIKMLPAPVQFAIRQVGGLFQFNQRLQVHYGDDDHPSQVRDQGFQFLHRDFLAGYKSHSLHAEMLPELTSKGLTALAPSVQKFLKPAMDSPESEPRETQMAHVAVAITIKKVPEPLTDAQLRDRREMLHQQKDLLQK